MFDLIIIGSAITAAYFLGRHRASEDAKKLIDETIKNIKNDLKVKKHAVNQDRKFQENMNKMYLKDKEAGKVVSCYNKYRGR